MATRKALIRCKNWPPEEVREVPLENDSNMTDAIRETLRAIDLEDFIINDESLRTIHLVAELPKLTASELAPIGAGIKHEPMERYEVLDAIGGNPIVDYLGVRWLIFRGRDQPTDYSVSFH